MLRISTRLTLWYLFASAIIIIANALAMYYIYNDQRRKAIDNDLKEYAEFLIDGLGVETTDLSVIFDVLLQKKEKPSSIIKAHRFVLASRDSLIFETNTLSNLETLLSQLDEKHQFSTNPEFNTFNLDGVEYRIYSAPFKIEKKRTFQLIVISSLDKLYESLAQLRYILMLILPVSLTIFGIIGFFIARKALSPVRDITRAAEAISFQSVEKRVPVSKTDDELANLAKTFNEMIERLENTFKSQQRFIADASHDIRTPLTVMQMELELLNNRPGLDEKTRQTSERCLREINSMSQLAENLLLLARADAKQLSISKKSFCLDEIVIECLSSMKNLAKIKNINFRFYINQKVDLLADESLFRRAIINILDNAIKFSPENETLKISVGEKDNIALFTVNNKGVPIPKETQSKIFDRFHRGDQSRTSSGFGLGLAIVKAIVDVHNGKIIVKSNEEQGTTFIINIPLNKKV